MIFCLHNYEVYLFYFELKLQGRNRHSQKEEKQLRKTSDGPDLELGQAAQCWAGLGSETREKKITIRCCFFFFMMYMHRRGRGSSGRLGAHRGNMHVDGEEVTEVRRSQEGQRQQQSLPERSKSTAAPWGASMGRPWRRRLR